MNRLITSSLIDAISWLDKCPANWQTRAQDDLLRTLTRATYTMNEAQQQGVNFENAVYACAAQELPNGGSESFQWFVQQAKGGVFQKKLKRILMIDGIEYCFYGKTDIWFPTVIKDIKTTENYKGSQSYLAKFQHRLYCWLGDIDSFMYLVAVFKDKKIDAKYAIPYNVKDRAALGKSVMETVKEAIVFLTNHKEYFDAWTTKYSLY